jgi:acyl dehydratase
MIDRQWIGFATAPSTIVIDRWHVRLFCRAIGEANNIHWDEAAARDAGLAACPVPPTFLKAIETEHCTSAALLGKLGVPVRSVLHAEQSFEYLAPVHVGDALEVSRLIADTFKKRDGALSFIVVDTHFRRAEATVCTSRQTIVVRNRAESE